MQQQSSITEREREPAERRIGRPDGYGEPPAGTPGRRALLWIAAVLAVFAAVAVMRGIGRTRPGAPASAPSTAAPAPPRAALVTVARPNVAPVEDALEITGTVRARQQVTLTPRISEKVTRILVDEGDRVAPGQILVLLDDTTPRAQMAQAEAGVASARARLGQTVAGKGVQDTAATTKLQQAEADLDAAQARLRQVQTRESLMSVESDTSVLQAENDLATARTAVAQADAQLASARAQVENARARFTRRDQLVREGAISREDRDEAERALDVAVAGQKAAEEGSAAARLRVQQTQTALDWAKTNVQRKGISREDVEAARAQVVQSEAAVRAARANLAQTAVTAEDVNAARAAVRQAEANLRIVREQWRNTRIVAPVKGVVARRLVNLGQSVTPTTPLLELVTLDDLYLEGQVSEAEVPSVRAGLPVTVRVDSLPGRTLNGRISEVIPLAQAGSRTFRVRVRLANDPGLKPGSFGRGRVVIRRAPDALLIPKTAIVDRDGQSMVYVVSGSKAHRRPVQLGVATRDAVEIRQGLDATDRVVIRGAAGLIDGASVEVAG
jgi:multidrug efflux pump subunit AcrA (membrane-fusion protein)